jgi:hypothetical protein
MISNVDYSILCLNRHLFFLESSKMSLRIQSSTDLKRTATCAMLATATVFLRNIRLGNLKLVEGTLAQHAVVLPFWLLDWMLDMVKGGFFRTLLLQTRLLVQGSLSAPVSEPTLLDGTRNSKTGQEEAASVRVNHLTHAAGGALLQSPDPCLSTLHDLATNAFEKFGSWPCLGSRELLSYKRSPPTGDRSKAPSGPPVKVFGETKWLTYKEVQLLSLDFGVGLKTLVGLTPQPNPDTNPSYSFDDHAGDSSLCIFENTVRSWGARHDGVVSGGGG